jgi:hypothetical protein
MNEPTTDRIDLPVLEDHVVNALACNVERENGVDAGVRAKDRGKVLKFRDSRERLRAAAIDDDRYFPLCPQTAVYVLSLFVTLLSFNNYFLCHITSGSAFKVQRLEFRQP